MQIFNRQKMEQFKNRTPHDPILTGNNLSYMTLGYFPREELEKILPRAMSIPPDAVMAREFPTLKKMEGMHPFTMMFSNCNNVHDMMTDIELRPYRELMFFIPVIYTREKEEQLCSYIPVMYLEYLLGVIGGLYLGLRKEFHPKMKDVETDTSKSFIIEDILDASFQKTSTDGTDGSQELDPFFTQTIQNPTLTVSYLNRTYFYTTRVYPTRVLDASPVYKWYYKGSVIKSNVDTFANYSEYSFTTSQAMRYEAYFHPTYSVE
ncbi:MAG: hypothetical protein JRS35_00930 [Deltaproteobacteria bacterium]|nr:hypothetical protein [Deltaproteobacteria bacterium]